MKKILAVIDAVNYKEEQLDAIEYMSGMLNGNLTIVMLEDTNSITPLMAPDFATGVPGRYYEIVIKASEEKGRIVKDNTAALRNTCTERGLSCVIHSDKGSAEEEIILESRFADLILVGKDLSFPFLFDTEPTGFVKNVLAGAQCPVMVIPKDISTVEGVIFTYNGTFSSMYAIKAFAAIFPEIIAKDATVLYVCEKGHDTIPHEKLLREYLDSYNRNITYEILSGKAASAIQAYLEQKPGHIATFGAYGGSRLSRFFNSSSAENILRMMKGPLFITHP
jgi:nucleotide-binding universal stress UspA family protein